VRLADLFDVSLETGAGLVFVFIGLAIGGWLLGTLLTSGCDPSLRRRVQLALACAGPVGYWMVKGYVETGNPVWLLGILGAVLFAQLWKPVLDAWERLGVESQREAEERGAPKRLPVWAKVVVWLIVAYGVLRYVWFLKGAMGQ